MTNSSSTNLSISEAFKTIFAVPGDMGIILSGCDSVSDFLRPVSDVLWNLVVVIQYQIFWDVYQTWYGRVWIIVRMYQDVQIWDLRSEISDLRPQIWDLRSEISDLRSQIWDLGSERSDLRSRIWDLRSAISDLRSQIWDLRSEISDLRSQVWDLRSGIGSKRSRSVPRPIRIRDQDQIRSLLTPDLKIARTYI